MSRSQRMPIWTAAEIAKLREMYDADASFDAMKRELGRTSGAIGAALKKHYPDRRIRHTHRLTPEMIERIFHFYGEGLTYDQIADETGVSHTTVSAQLAKLKKDKPSAYAALRSVRAAKLKARGLDLSGRPKCWGKVKKSLADGNGNHRAYSDLDRAIDYLRKFTGVWKERNTGKVVYGTTRKTPAEIIALAERKGMAL